MKKSNTFKLIISEEVERKIRYICQQVWNDEWSGTLFYKPEGKFEDGSLTIRCVDIYVMDIGTAAYTEFDMSPDVVSYMANNPELLDCQMGLIHSHNNMSTFFSSTDIDTLKEEGIDRNHFVSLIVNNAGTYTAAITRRVKSTKTITENLSYPTFGDNKAVEAKVYDTEIEELEWFYLTIEFEDGRNHFCEELKTRLEEIKEEKKKNKNSFFNTRFEENNKYTNWKNSNYQQGTLFPELEREKESSNIYQTNTTNKNLKAIKNETLEENCALPYGQLKFNKEIIKSLVMQLITGSVIISNSSKIDINHWAKNMSALYERRFGKGKEGMELFTTWAEGYIDFLCWFAKDKDLEELELDGDEMAAICANDIIEELSNLPKNVYIQKYINILTQYLI